MPTPQEEQIERMCAHEETAERAFAILKAAAPRTAPGSGYDIGLGKPGLPAICAFLASEQLSNDDVSEKTAQSVSCLAPRIFRSTLGTVRAALAAQAAQAPERQRRGPSTTRLTYAALLSAHKVLLAATVAGWLADAERVLDGTAAFRAAAHNARAPAVKCAVFFWVTRILGLTRIKREDLLRLYELDDAEFSEVLDLLELHGAARKAAIADEIAALKKKRPKPKAAASADEAGPSTAPSSEPEAHTDTDPGPPPSAPSSPRKSALRRPPAPDTPQTPRRAVKFRAGPEAPDTDTRTPTKTPRRFPSTAAAVDDGEGTPRRFARRATTDDGPATPRAKRGSRSPSKSPSKSSRRAKSPSPVPSDEEEEDEDDYVAPPRRYRPIFADRQQWLAPDPRAAREWAAARRAAAKAEELWGHPFRHAMEVE